MKNSFENRARIVSSGSILYVKDDFYDAAVRIVPTGKGEITYIKYRGEKEKKIEHSADIVYQIECGGEIISKDDYELF